MTRAGLLAFIRAQKWAVEASVSPSGAPQAAAIGVAVTDDFELLFDTLSNTRKAKNLRANPTIAVVIGWDDEQTVQYEGVVDEPVGDELAKLKRVYVAKFPDGVQRESWPGITYFRAKPTWIRYTDFRGSEPVVVELAGNALRTLA